MDKKTYYMILGVSSTESDRGIRAAYRDLAKRLHPDVAGEQATRSFQEVSEAYGVLSDPQRRREYNNKLNRAEDGGIVTVRRSPPEPLVREPVTILGNRDGIRPSFEAMYARFLRNFTGIGVPKSEQLESLTFEVLLTPEEASRGCVVPIGVPVFTRCPQCGGSGRDWVFSYSYLS
jgi:DnaJ-class molecular chaperone